MNAYIDTVRMDARKVANAVPVDITPSDTVLIADAVSDVWVHHVERLMGALRAAGVSDRLVNEIAAGGDPNGGLVANDG